MELISGMTNLTGRRVGGHEIGRLIGEGGGGTVYAARTTEVGPAGEAGSVVALKVFHPQLISDERIFQRFQREAELGMKIRHPHVVGTFATGCEDVDGTPCHYMTMELIEGETLRDTLSELGALPEHLVYQISDQVLDALTAVHAVGMIHRDIKPENIVLTHGDQQVRLMDLGVARLQQEGRDLTRAGEFVGSIAYAAPEQFTDQDHVDPRADIYAFGVMLYEITTGKNPYDAAELGTVITQKLRGQVRRPKVISRDLDPFLDEVILTCLHTDPDTRFKTCEELRQVLMEGEEGSWWKGRIEGDAFPAAARALKRLRPPREADLVGRDADLERLHQAYEQARDGRGAVLFVAGVAGVGKSRLVHDFVEELVAPDGPVTLVGRCPAEPGRSAHAFLEAASDFLRDRDGAEARLAELLAESPAVAPRLAADLFGETRDVPAEELTNAYAALLKGLAQERPVVLVIEDLHHGDPETIALFGHVARSAPGGRQLVIGTYRSEEVEEGSALHTMVAGTDSLTVEPLDRDTVEELVQAVVSMPRTVRALGWQLFAASDGSPHYVLDALAHLRKTGALAETDDGWALADPLQQIVLPATIRELSELKLKGLEADLLALLETAAVQGHEFDASLLAAVTGQRRLRLLKRLAALERKHRLLQSSGKNAFQFASHGLHDVVYENTPDERRRELHSQCADVLRDDEEQELTGARAHQWVRHLLLAGRLAEAGDRVAPAVDYAATHFHAAEGAQFLTQIVDGLAPGASHTRFEVYMRLAAHQRMLGRPEASKEALARAADEADLLGAPGPRGRVQAALAAMSWRAGDYERAHGEAAGGLALAEEAGDRECQALCLHALGIVAQRRGDCDQGADFWRKALEIRRDVGDRRGEAATLQRLGAAMPEIGEPEQALETKQAALQILRELGDRRAEGAALNNVGNSMVDAERIQEALVCYEQSVKIARECGDMPAEGAALYNLARVYTIEARIDEAKQAFERALDIFRQLEDPSGEAGVLDELGSAMATFGERNEALSCLELARKSAERTGEKALLARVLRHLATVHHEQGRHDEAWGLYDRALDCAGVRTRSAILSDMGNAAEREGDYDKAVRLLEESLDVPAGTSRALVSLCRLARAHKAAGRDDDAAACARRAEEMIQAEKQAVAPNYGPEVYYSLGTVLADEERGRRYLETANELLGARTRSIRSVVYRQHYLTTRWPNREILEEARRLS